MVGEGGRHGCGGDQIHDLLVGRVGAVSLSTSVYVCMLCVAAIWLKLSFVHLGAVMARAKCEFTAPTWCPCVGVYPCALQWRRAWLENVQGAVVQEGLHVPSWRRSDDLLSLSMCVCVWMCVCSTSLSQHQPCSSGGSHGAFQVRADCSHLRFAAQIQHQVFGWITIFE